MTPSQARPEVASWYLVVHEELRPFEVPRSHSHVVLLPWVVELSQTPVDQTQLEEQEAGEP